MDRDPIEQVKEAHAYLSRLLTHCAPTCEPLPDLYGVCTQIDNLLTGLRSAGRDTRPDTEWRDMADGSPLDEALTVLCDHYMETEADALEARCSVDCGHRLAGRDTEPIDPPLEAIRAAAGLVASECNRWEGSHSAQGVNTHTHWRDTHTALAGYLLAMDVQADLAGRDTRREDSDGN